MKRQFLFLKSVYLAVTFKFSDAELEKKKREREREGQTAVENKNLSHHLSKQEWVAFPFSRGSSQPRDETQVSHISGGFFTS